MLGSPVLEVAVGLIFIYWLLSLICSGLTELIATGIFHLRARTLEEGIRNMLGDPTGDGMAKALYHHPMITGFWLRQLSDNQLSKSQNTNLSRKELFSCFPQYIPASTFALVLLDVVAPTQSRKDATLESVKEGIKDFVTRVETQLDEDFGDLTQEFRIAITKEIQTKLSRRDVPVKITGLMDCETRAALRNFQRQAAIVASGNPDAATLHALGFSLLEQPIGHLRWDGLGVACLGRLLHWLCNFFDSIRCFFETSYRDLLRSKAQSTPRLKLSKLQLGYTEIVLTAAIPTVVNKVVLPQLEGAGSDLRKGRKEIESWFNNSMDHVSGLYKRRTLVWIILLSTIVVFTLNADTIKIARRLWQDPILREALVSTIHKESEPATKSEARNGTEQTQAGKRETGTELQTAKHLESPDMLGWRIPNNQSPGGKAGGQAPSGVALKLSVLWPGQSHGPIPSEHCQNSSDSH
jgi:hypothetical protein